MDILHSDSYDWPENITSKKRAHILVKMSVFSFYLSLFYLIFLLHYTFYFILVVERKCFFFFLALLGDRTHFKEIPDQESICLPELYRRN